MKTGSSGVFTIHIFTPGFAVLQGLFLLPAFTSGGWVPLGEDCDFQQKLFETNSNEYNVLSCIYN
ncbi:MAG: hypothetical protein IMY71_10390 [Bacteroidetes bacterium]|nr:hypothetical protein [Bacteroidota bacterium]